MKCDDDILMMFRPGTGSSGDHVSVQMPGSRDPDTAETPGTNLPADAKLVARNFSHMRRKITIIAYKPPEGKKGIIAKHCECLASGWVTNEASGFTYQ